MRGPAGPKRATRLGRVPLDRTLSKRGLASRSTARQWIAAGRVTVNGRVAVDPSRLVTPESAVIAVDGRTEAAAPWRLVAFHKPRGVVTTTQDPDGRRTVFEVLGSAGARLMTVGRLDMASTGLMLLTTDTRLAHWLAAPSTGLIRRYVATARGLVSDADAERMETGIGALRAMSVRIRKRSARETHLIIELDEGRNREIRTLLAATGHEVTKLLRVAFGGIELRALLPGEWRDVTRAEARRAFPSAPIRGETTE